MESESSYNDFDMMMEDAMSRLNIIVDSTPTITAKKTSNVGELIYQNPQIYNSDYNAFSYDDSRMDYIDDQEDISDCDCDCDKEYINPNKPHKCVELTQIYDSSVEIDTIATIATIAPIDENDVYKINYDDHYDEEYEFYGDDNGEDSDDDVYENMEHSYHAERMDKQTGKFGRI